MADIACGCYLDADAPRVIVYCPLHAAALELLKALRASAVYGHKVGGYHSPNFVKFEECKKAECAAAREAIRKAGGE